MASCSNPLALLRKVTFIALASALVSPVVAQNTQRASQRLWRESVSKDSTAACISADGRFVAFTCKTSRLHHSLNYTTDVMLYDRTTHIVERVSVSSSGARGARDAGAPSISADGHFVAFDSIANNLVSGDLNHTSDIFVHDRLSNQTTLVSVSSLAVPGDLPSYSPSISADGRYVAFESEATTLVAGDANAYSDIFIHDRWTGNTKRINVNAHGGEGNGHSRAPVISADGRFVSFESSAGNLVLGDSNHVRDIFVHDLASQITTLVSVSSNGTSGNRISTHAAISADGRFIAFESRATNLVMGDTNGWSDVFVHDRELGVTRVVSVDAFAVVGDKGSDNPSISSNGRFISFHSRSDNFATSVFPRVKDVFVHDCLLGTTDIVSVDSAGVPGNGHSSDASISADGQSIAFESIAGNLVHPDRNHDSDIFVHFRGAGSGADEDTIVLTCGVLVEVGERLHVSWFAAPPGAFTQLLASWSHAGSTLAGHMFGVGPGALVIARSFATDGGVGSHTTAPMPGSALGRTLYLEVAARDASGRIYDSNTVERTVQ